MKGKKWALTLAAVAGFFSLLASAALATPIRPDLQKLLSQPQEAAIQFAPARAGWHGPEMTPPAALSGAQAALLDPSVAAKTMRNTLIAAALPDPRLLVLLLAAIFLLRRLRRRPAAPAPQAAAPTSEEDVLPKAA